MASTKMVIYKDGWIDDLRRLRLQPRDMTTNRSRRVGYSDIPGLNDWKQQSQDTASLLPGACVALFGGNFNVGD